jgi:hypothetical protein
VEADALVNEYVSDAVPRSTVEAPETVTVRLNHIVKVVPDWEYDDMT